MDLILDTTVLIDADRDQFVLDALVDDRDAVSISAVSYAELLHGVALADGRRRERRQHFVEAVAAEIPILSYDRRVAATHATLLAHVRRTGRPLGAHHLMVAATAAAHHLVVVTADTRAFGGLPGVLTRPADG